MGKLIVWIVLVFAILFLLRLWNARQSSSRRGDGKAHEAGTPSVESMVRCDQCGVFLPRLEARTTVAGYRCGDGGCGHRKPPSDGS